MASTAESIRRSPFATDHNHGPIHKSIPILPSSSFTPPGDPMDITPTNSNDSQRMRPPPAANSQNGDRPAASQNQNQQSSQSQSESPAAALDTPPTTNGSSSLPVGAAAAAQQPKVVQTAFIHKLYNMLEDPSIQHLISWSSTNESFVMSPSSEFSKVLSSYFKHTNISSFVRQLNMYGFHKVSDVFHTGQPDSPLWEFKHGNGSFKRGDLVGLREIKRRASRHALIHRDSFSTAPKVAPPPPGAQASVEHMQDPQAMGNALDSRLQQMDHTMYELLHRANRTEDSYAYLNQRYQFVSDGLLRCHQVSSFPALVSSTIEVRFLTRVQWNHELSSYLLHMIPDPENPVHKDVTMMQREIARQIDQIRSFDEPPEPLSSSRQTYFNSLHDTGQSLSPRQLPQDILEQRRGSLTASIPRPSPFRTPLAPHLAISPRRYGSIGSSSNTYSPSSARTPQHVPLQPPAPPTQHPLATSSSSSPPANLPRRHTSADIRLHGWNPSLAGQPQSSQPPLPPHAHSPYASGANSTQWPSSPSRAPVGDSAIQATLAQYELPRGPSSTNPTSSLARNVTPPPTLSLTSDGPNGPPMDAPFGSSWQLPGARFNFKGFGAPGSSGGLEPPGGGSMPPTRRSSMASNVHSLLNPAETVEREGEDEGEPGGGAKRKRV
ncbi:hypothetical protein P152DRAFT_325320 [Eremomyces bilateralis CBS 781.70]|uniref:HSF-type DNA-binding domain-containing protein n=1 Tax=Eremomyces bilateralis CBS 781.70 TaxID=1392243 RepID=A0A6G1G4A8_9PEZI|nr:uncharacterized protein P152DRAFT_325320 [Eremomyces bilateralis CBS 781.70]KAF1812750.1 hypothetical protein P152DRAFT_325320 [Eremomyces bilateralis CBS 781.70]